MTAAEALIENLETCRQELETIERMVDLVHDHHNPDTVNWGIVGSYGHLAELLTEAREFITSGRA